MNQLFARNSLLALRLLILLLASVFPLSPNYAEAENPIESTREWFVSSTIGDDTASDGSRERPFKSVQAALDRVSAGGSVVLLPGWYEGEIVLPAGKPGSPITLKADKPGRSFIGRPPILGGFSRPPGFKYASAAASTQEPVMITELTTNEVLRGLPSPLDVEQLAGSYCYDKASGQVFVHPSDSEDASRHLYALSVPSTGVTLADYTTIEGLAFTGFGYAAIAGKEVRHAVVRNCIAYANGYAVYLRGGEDCSIEGNRFWKNNPSYLEGSQIHITAPYARRIVIKDNVVYDSPRFGLRFYSSGPTDDCLMSGNLIYGNIQGGAYYKGGPGENQSGTRNVSVGNRNDDFRAPDGGHNTYGTLAAGWKHYLKESDLVLGNRVSEKWRFADPAYQDYRLQADSPARGASPDGSDLGALPYDGSVVYVAPDGNDKAEGTSRAAAWKTLSRAISGLRAGQTLYIAPAVWKEPLLLSNLKFPPESPTRIRVVGKGKAVFPAVLVKNCENLILEDITSAGPDARILIEKSSSIDLQRCIAERSSREGKAANGLSIKDSNAITVSHCAFIRYPEAGISVDDSRDVEVTSTLFLFNNRSQLVLDGDCSGFWSNFNAFIAPVDDSPLVRIDGKTVKDLKAWNTEAKLDLDSVQSSSEDFPGASSGDYRSMTGTPASVVGRYCQPAGPYGTRTNPTRKEIEGVEVTSVTKTSANIAFWTPGQVTGLTVEWGSDAHYGNRYSQAEGGVKEYETFHTFSMLGLEPEKKYHFRVGFIKDEISEDGKRKKPIVWSEDFTFTTAKEDPKPRDLYVSLDGDDGKDGLSPATAWRTIAHASRFARAGDTVTLAPGRYTELLRPLQSGVGPSQRITFRAQVPLTVFLDGGHSATLGGRSHCVQLMNKAYISLENLSFGNVQLQDNGGYRGGMGYSSLVLLSNAPGTEVKNCFMDGRGNYAIGLLALGAGDSPGVSAGIPEVVVEDSLFLRTWWSAAVYSERPAIFQNNAFVRSLIFMLGGNGADGSLTLRNNIYQSLIPAKKRNRLFANPGQLDSNYNCFAWDAENDLRHVAYVDKANRVFAQSLSGWQKEFKQDENSIESDPGYPLSRKAGFGTGAKWDRTVPIEWTDLLLPAGSPCLGAGENGEDIGPRWGKFKANLKDSNETNTP